MDKLFQLSGGLGQWYKDFRVIMLSKTPIYTFNWLSIPAESWTSLFIKGGTKGKTIIKLFFTKEVMEKDNHNIIGLMARRYASNPNKSTKTLYFVLNLEEALPTWILGKEMANIARQVPIIKVSCHICGRTRHTTIKCYY